MQTFRLEGPNLDKLPGFRPLSLFPIFFFLLLTTCQSLQPRNSTLLSIPKAQILLSGITKGKVTVVKTFNGPSGLTGILIKENSTHLAIVYATADAKTLIAGTLFDKNGINLTKQSADAFLKEETISTPKKTQFQEDEADQIKVSPFKMDLLEKETSFLSQGQGSKVLWIFFDPNCIWCHRLFLMIHQHPIPETIEIRWIPVGFLKSGSIGKASAILKNGFVELSKDEINFDTENEEGGAPIISSPKFRSMVQKNNRILKLLGNGGLETPTLIYRKKGINYLFPGFPDKGEWAGIIGALSP